MNNDSESALPQNITLPLLEAKGESWYNDPRDPRCPHDSWLVRFDFAIEGTSGDEAECLKTLCVTLLGAYHNGVITFTYKGVRAYNLVLKKEEIPGRIWRRSDWLEDSATALNDGHLHHSIEWETEKWIVEAREIIYDWVPSPRTS